MPANPTPEERAREIMDQPKYDALHNHAATRADLLHDIEAAITSAVEAEREACELIALRWRDNEGELASRGTADAIASLIRARSLPSPPRKGGTPG